MKPFASWIVASIQGLCASDENSLAALLSQLGHEGIHSVDLAAQVRSRALHFLKRDSVKALRPLLTRPLTSALHRWRTQASLTTAAIQYRKLRSYAVKLTREIKDRPKVEIKSARPAADSKIPVPRIATEKLSEDRHRGRSRSILKDKENEWQETPKAAPETVEKPRLKRPTSVPPKRPSEDSLISKVQTEARQKANLVSRRDLRTGNEADCVGQRLYQHAQELEKKREQMRKSLEPEYSFTPQIAQSTDKWLLHKGAKPTRVAPPDEVAIVSSASVLSFLNNNSLKDIKLPLAFVTPKSQPLVPLVCTNLPLSSRPADEPLSKRYHEDSSHTLSVVDYDPLSEDA